MSSKSKVPVWVWFVLAGGIAFVGLVVVGSVVAGAAFFFASRQVASGTGGVGAGGEGAGGSAAGGNGVVGRRTFTREEVKAHCFNGAIYNQDMIRAKFGDPDKTYETRKPWESGPVKGEKIVTSWVYYKLTVDVSGSGKVDRETVFKFGEDGSPLFIP